MRSTCFYNGKFTTWDEVLIPLCDRAVFFGDGVYDACIGRRETVYLLDEHLERFYCNLCALTLDVPYSKNEIKDIIKELLKENTSDFFLYFQATRNLNKRAHACCEGGKANLLIYFDNFTLPSANTRLSLITYPDLRYGYCNIKTLNLLPNTLAATKAKQMGCDEAIFIRNGYVTECAHSNISIIVGNTLYTHPLDNTVLPGICRKHLLKTAKDLGVRVCEKAFEKHEMFTADAVLVSSTSKLVLPATQIDSIKVKNNYPLANALVDKMREDFLLAIEK